jgi:uncharacterized delta-60 repeat protein
VRYNSDGTLDTSFDSNAAHGPFAGAVVTDFSHGIDKAYSVLIQSDGKIVAVGSATISGKLDFALARYNTDGTLDTTFDSTGLLGPAKGLVVTTNFSRPSEAFAAAFETVNGSTKIVAVGYGATAANANDFVLARYNSDGTLDTTFDSTGLLGPAKGLVATDFGSADDEAFAVAIQSDGKIVAAGRKQSNTYDFALARYNTDGTLDTTFGSSGKVVTNIGADDEVFGVVIQSDGTIIAAGKGNAGSYFTLAAYSGSNGSLVTSFGTGGVVTSDGSSGSIIHAIALEP